MHTSTNERSIDAPQHRRRWLHRLLVVLLVIAAAPAVTAGPVGAIADGASAPTG